jgi:uncharacterized membrane protein
MARLIVITIALICALAAPAAAAAPVPTPLTSSAGHAELAGFGGARSRGFGYRPRANPFRTGYGRRGYGYSRRGHGFLHGLFWGWFLGHFLFGGGFPVFPFLVLLIIWAMLRSRRRRRQRWGD